MMFTRSMTAANSANAKATKPQKTSKNVAVVVPPATTPVVVVVAPICNATKPDSKQRRAERRRLETLAELSELGAIATMIVETKRIRRQAQHPDLAFYQASAKQSVDAGKRGGLVARSMHAYDRTY